MPIICWGNLVKAADDTQRIEQAIDEYIEGHNENPNAHMGENYALGAHRLQTVLDHSPYSIFNLHTYPQARSYKAIVDPTGNQDFTDIQAAIDYVHGLGGGAIFIKAGTYTLTSDITLYNNIEIVGEDNDSVIFDFNSGVYQFKLIGTAATHKKNCWLKNIQIKNSRKGVAGACYFNYVDNSGIVNCKFQNNKASAGGFGVAVSLANSSRICVEDNYFYDNEVALEVSNCTLTKIYKNDINDSDTIGIFLDAGLNNFVFNNLIRNSANSAIQLESSDRSQIIGNFIDVFTSYGITTGENNPTSYLVIANNYIEDGGDVSAAISLYFDSRYCSIVGNVLKNNNGEGVYLASGSRNTITGNVITGGGRGVYLDDSSDRNIVLANILIGNSTAITNEGTNTEIGHNITS